MVYRKLTKPGCSSKFARVHWLIRENFPPLSGLYFHLTRGGSWTRLGMENNVISLVNDYGVNTVLRILRYPHSPGNT